MLNEALRLIRVFHNLKQTETAEKLGVSQSFLSEIERGTKVPSLDLIQKYSEVFEIPASSILYFSENIDDSSAAIARNFVAQKVVALMQFLERRGGAQ